jgi:excisionase family DNA binding protein
MEGRRRAQSGPVDKTTEAFQPRARLNMSSGEESAALPGAPRRRSAVPPRFLQLADVAEMLNISVRQAYTLVKSGDLPAIQVGGRGQWRVEATELEAYIQRLYAETRAQVESRPSGQDDEAQLEQR